MIREENTYTRITIITIIILCVLWLVVVPLPVQYYIKYSILKEKHITELQNYFPFNILRIIILLLKKPNLDNKLKD